MVRRVLACLTTIMLVLALSPMRALGGGLDGKLSPLKENKSASYGVLSSLGAPDPENADQSFAVRYGELVAFEAVVPASHSVSVESSGIAEYPMQGIEYGLVYATWHFAFYADAIGEGSFDLYDDTTGELLKRVEFVSTPLEDHCELVAGEPGWTYSPWGFERVECDEGLSVEWRGDTSWDEQPIPWDYSGGASASRGQSAYAAVASEPGTYQARFYHNDKVGQVTTFVVSEPVKSYLITYKDGCEGSLFEDKQFLVEKGKPTPEFDGSLIRDGYIFTGWSPKVASLVADDATYIAQWKEDDRPIYTVTFTDGCNGESFADFVYNVREGEETPIPEDEYFWRAGYEFTGWGEIAGTVTADATYVAQWVANADYVVAIDEGPITITVSNPWITSIFNWVTWKTTNVDLGYIGNTSLQVSGMGVVASVDFYPTQEGYAVLYATDSNGARTVGTCSVLVTPSNKTDIATLDFTLTTPEVPYRPWGSYPEIKIMDGSYELEEGTDYYFDWWNCYQVGQASGSVLGSGMYRSDFQFNYTIVPADIASLSFQPIEDETYTGEEHKPQICITHEGYELQESVDYDVAYSDNVNVGKAEAVVTGKGNYEGTKTIEFDITPRDVAVVARPVEKVAGEPDPELTAEVTGLVGSDTISYTLTRVEGEHVGTYAIAATGEASQGNYRVSFEGSELTIVPADISGATVTVSPAVYTGEKCEPTTTVALGGKELNSGTDYEVAYADNLNAGWATATITGTGDFAGSKAVGFYISRANVTVVAPSASKVYGDPDPDLTAEIIGLIGSDTVSFAISREDGEDAGTYLVMVSGDTEQGNYSVTCVSGELTIAARDISDAVVAIESVAYTGKPQEPALRVTCADRDLVRGVDYDVVYSDNVNVGKAEAVVTGKGNYAGKKAETFEVATAQLADASITPIANQIYTGMALTPSFEVMANGVALIPVKDFDVVYENNTEVGFATITITGKGNCNGARTVTFKILPQAPFFIDADPADDRNHGFEVDWMGRSGISEGWLVTAGREYRGLKNVTRCDFAAFLYRMADLSDDGRRNDSNALTESQVVSTLAGVSDCNLAKTPHINEIAWMISSGISKGWADKGGKTVSFKPMNAVARQDMAAFLYRFASLRSNGNHSGTLPMGSESVTFTDVVHDDSTNHAAEVEWLASIGVTKGWDVGNGVFEFRGRRNVARQDMAAFMYRLDNYLS